MHKDDTPSPPLQRYKSASSNSSRESSSSTLYSDTLSDATLIVHSPSMGPLSNQFRHPRKSPPLHSRIPDRPLIERVTNEWRSNPKYNDFYSRRQEDEYGQFVMTDDPRHKSRICPVRIPRKPQRLLAIYLGFLLSCFLIWKSWIKPTLDQNDRLDRSVYHAAVYGKKFGTNARPEFIDMIQVQYMDSRYIPGASSASPKRIIFIGDVHGCKTELLALLEKVSFSQATDHLVFTGDIIFKGPDSKGVIDLARSMGASCVRGNHEDRVLLAYASVNGAIAPVDDSTKIASPVTKTHLAKDTPVKANAGPSEDSIHGDIRHQALANKLSREQIEWLQKCPVILNVGRIGGSKGADYVVVHAGLVPGVPLDKQDPFQVMNMRTIDLATRVPTELRGGEPWEKVWNHFQKAALPEPKRKTVIYGHDAKRGLKLEKYSKGLDSSCVRGGKLSALIVDEHGKEKVVSIKCSVDYTTDAMQEIIERQEEGLDPKMGVAA